MSPEKRPGVKKNKKNAKSEMHMPKKKILKNQALACERISTKRHSTESRCVIRRSGKHTVCGRAGALFSQEPLQTGAVKGLMVHSRLTQPAWWA